MLTGYKPYHSESVIDIVIQHKTSPVPTLPETLSIYQNLLDKMMAKNIDERFVGVEDMLESINQLQSIDSSHGLIPDFDITGNTQSTGEETKTKKKSKMILLSLLVLSSIFFFGLQFVEINLKGSNSHIDQASTSSVLSQTASTTRNLAEQTLESIQSATETEKSKPSEIKEPAEPASEEVTNALAWLGKQSLEEYKLTYPPKDNAYYYFSRLLELQPDNRSAYEGILSIAERYAILAERTLADNDVLKTRSYIDFGLQINPENKALLSMKSILEDQKSSFWNTIKSFF